MARQRTEMETKRLFGWVDWRNRIHTDTDNAQPLRRHIHYICHTHKATYALARPHAAALMLADSALVHNVVCVCASVLAACCRALLRRINYVPARTRDEEPLNCMLSSSLEYLRVARGPRGCA